MLILSVLFAFFIAQAIAIPGKKDRIQRQKWSDVSRSAFHFIGFLMILIWTIIMTLIGKKTEKRSKGSSLLSIRQRLLFDRMEQEKCWRCDSFTSQ